MIIDRNLRAKIGTKAVGVVAKSVARGALRSENQELIVLHVKTELLGDIVVVLGGLVAGTAGAVEAASSVDARGGDVAVVLTRDGVAGSALRRRRRVTARSCHGGRGEEGGEEDGGGLHVAGCYRLKYREGVNECGYLLGAVNVFQRLIDGLMDQEGFGQSQ